MEDSGYTHIGSLVKLHGFKGTYVLVSEFAFPSKLSKWESVFVEVDKLPVPFFISSVNLVNESLAHITFDDITTSEQAKEFVGCQVLQENSLLGKKPKAVVEPEFVNFKVYDKHHGYIGTIDGMEEYSQNILFRIVNGDKEILIPAIEAYIVSVDLAHKELHVQTPEGLLEIND